jgi:hypothetical protein
MRSMTEQEAVTFLKSLFAAKGIEGLQKFAPRAGVKWTTAYGWYRRESIPEWRLPAIKKAMPRGKK